MTIDSHVHLYPDSIAAKVTPSLAGRFGNAPAFNGTVDGCVATAADAGIAVSVNLPVATSPGSIRHTNEFWAAFAARAKERRNQDAVRPPSRVVSLAAFHPGVERKGEEIEWIARAGFTGIKLHPEYQDFRFNDSVMDEAWAAMQEFGIVAYLHAGGERVFKAPFHSSPAEIAELQRRFPRLRIVAAHLGGFGMWDEAERDIVGSPVNLDLSHTFNWMPDEQILRMVRRHGASRILFGTDAPWQNPADIIAAFRRMPFTDAESAAMLHENAAALLSIEP